MTAPLAGIRVLEVADYVTGPYAAMMLGQLGADVVKIERPPRGDLFRTYGLKHEGTSAFWYNVNRGKRSVLLDLKQPGQRQVLLGLVQAADVFVQNWRPGVAEELGLGDDILTAVNPALVRIFVTGFGTQGPRAKLPAFDTVVQAISGMAVLQGSADSPTIATAMIVDKATGAFAAQAALAALVRRGISGEGARIDLAMLDVAAFFNFPDLMQGHTFLDCQEAFTPMASPIVRTVNGSIVAVPVSGKQIKRAAQAAGHPEWSDDLKQFGTPHELMKALTERLREVAQDRKSDDLLAAFADEDVPAAPVFGPTEHFVDPQVEHNELYAVTRDARFGKVRSVRYPATFDGSVRPTLTGAPDLGAHTDEVVAEWQPRPERWGGHSSLDGSEGIRGPRTH